MIIINTKNYKTGSSLLKLVKLIEKHLPRAIVAVPTNEINNIVQNTRLKVYSQYMDSANIVKLLKAKGAQGTILNHSDHPLKLDVLKETLKECKKARLKTIVCVPSLKEIKKILKLKPYAIAYEDPKLIGTGKSITKYKTKELEEFARIMNRTKVIPLCGAGISSSKDVKQARKLGCRGVLIASAIANNHEAKFLLKNMQDI